MLGNLHRQAKSFTRILRTHDYSGNRAILKECCNTYTSAHRSMSSKNDQVYLHISPCGDWWSGTEVFAAKHLQPDYVKSIPIPESLETDMEELLESYEGNVDILMKGIYDSGDVKPLLILNEKKSSEW